MAVLKRTKQAEHDLIDIWLYIAIDSYTSADKLLDRLDITSNLIADNPNMGKERTDIRKGLHYFPVDNYLILYRIIEGGAEMVRYIPRWRDLFALTIEKNVKPKTRKTIQRLQK